MFTKFTTVHILFLLIKLCIGYSDSTVNRVGESRIRITRQVKTSCTSDQFKCKNQNCVPLVALCNNINECGDNSDESTENCKIINTGSCQKENRDLKCDELDFLISRPLFRSSEDPIITAEKSYSFLCQGYLIPKNESNIVLQCKNNIWTPLIRSCTRLCQQITFLAESITCYRNDKNVTCKAPFLIGTKIRVTCPTNYKPTFEEATCNANGEWNHNLVECVPICGQNFKTKVNLVSVPSVRPVEKREFPWNAALYGLDKSVPLCPLTLISPNLALTATSCVYNIQSKSMKVPIKNLEIIVAKIRREAWHRDDELQRSYQVYEIFLPEDEFQGTTNNIAILKLSKRVNSNAAVSPICINWSKNEKWNPQDGTMGKVPTWRIIFGNGTTGRTSSLVQIAMKYSKSSSCLRETTRKNPFFTKNQFCVEMVKLLNPQQVGSAWYYIEKSSNSYFLAGLLNMENRPDSKNNKELKVFTNINFYMDWINRIRLQADSRILKEFLLHFKPGRTDIVCKSSVLNVDLPVAVGVKITSNENLSVIGGSIFPKLGALNAANYTLDCNSTQDDASCRNIEEGSVVPLMSKLSLICQAGYELKMNESATCVSNQWENPPLCIRTYSSLKTDNMKLDCFMGNNTINCDGMLKAGTRVVAKCYSHHKIENDASEFLEILCKASGEWSSVLPKCVPNFVEKTCGIIIAQNVSLPIIEERHVFRGELPWHVGVYDITNNSKELVCGGTIISEFIVLSAARCFVDEGQDTKREPRDFAIAAGRLRKDYSHVNSEQDKFYAVEKVIYEDFMGRKTKYRSDIVIVVTRTKIEFNTFVRPICINNSTKDIVIPTNATLKIASWGLDEKFKTSSMLKITEVPFIRDSDCIREGPPALLDFLTDDRFCSGNMNRLDQDIGDIGAGLIYQDAKTLQCYLYGILSMKSTDIPSLALFTSIQYYKDWILRNQQEEIYTVKPNRV